MRTRATIAAAAAISGLDALLDQPAKRRTLCSLLAAFLAAFLVAFAARAEDPLPSWNDGAPKKAILDFVAATTSPSSPHFVRPEQRAVTFDQDGTTWVEHPMYTQVVFVLDRVAELVRTYAEQVYDVPPEQVIGTAFDTQYQLDDKGQGVLLRAPNVLLDDNFSGKAEDIHLFLGRHPNGAFGNSTGDQQMLEYTQAGGAERLTMLVLHDDARREYAYGPAQDLPDTKVGTFTQALYDEARTRGWTVISMKNDWRRIFPAPRAAAGAP